MTEKKNQNRKQELAKKNAVESLRFHTHFGLKMMGREENDLFNKLADAEINFIAELDLTQDILDLKSLVDGVKKDLQVLPTPENGDFCTSVTAIALHIASIPSLDRMAMPVTWRELIDKKILTQAAKSKNAAANAIKIRFVFLNFIVYFLCNSVDIIMFFAIIKISQ